MNQLQTCRTDPHLRAAGVWLIWGFVWVETEISLPGTAVIPSLLAWQTLPVCVHPQQSVRMSRDRKGRAVGSCRSRVSILQGLSPGWGSEPREREEEGPGQPKSFAAPWGEQGFPRIQLPLAVGEMSNGCSFPVWAASCSPEVFDSRKMAAPLI